MIQFTIPVTPITKKNSMQIVPIKTKTGGTRHIIIPSKQFKNFENDCKPFVEQALGSTAAIDYAVNVKCLFYMPTKRKVDLTNLLESIDDVLAKWGLLADDNRDIVASHDGSKVLYDKEKPRIEIAINKITNYEQWSKNKND